MRFGFDSGTTIASEDDNEVSSLHYDGSVGDVYDIGDVDSVNSADISSVGTADLSDFVMSDSENDADSVVPVRENKPFFLI